MTAPRADGPSSSSTLRHGREDRTSLPHVSVVMPVRNGEPWLELQLAALAEQTYRGEWEVLVVDNGSTDRTVEVSESWRDRVPLRVVAAHERPGINVARNAGAELAKGELLLFCDSDDIAAPDWVERMAASALTCDVVAGRLDEETLNVAQGPARRPRIATEHLPVALEFLPFAPGANFGVWRDVLVDVGFFDERYMCGNDDVEFSFRVQLNGFRIGYAPDAVVQYRHRQGRRQLFRQFRGYGRAEPMLFARYRDFGMPRPPLRQVVGRWLRLVRTWPALFRDPARCGLWVVELGYSVGRLEGSFRGRVAFF